MLWTITVAVRRQDQPPLPRYYAVVADEPHAAQEMVRALLGNLVIVEPPRVDAHQAGIVEVAGIRRR